MHDCGSSRGHYTPSGQPTGKWVSFKTDLEARRLFRGWEVNCIETRIEDKSDWHLCEMCEEEEARYVHHMSRPKEDDQLVEKHFGCTIPRVGCICAGWMTGYFDQFGDREYFKKLDPKERQHLNKKHEDSCMCSLSRADERKARKDKLNGVGYETQISSIGLGATAAADRLELAIKEKPSKADKKFVSKNIRHYARDEEIPEIDLSRTGEAVKKFGKRSALEELRQAHKQGKRLRKIKDLEKGKHTSTPQDCT